MAGGIDVQFKLPNTLLFRHSGAAAVSMMADESLKAVVKGGAIVTRHAKNEAPKVFGELMRSIFAEVTMQPIMSRILPHIKYAMPVNFGRRPGKQPPAYPIQMWARKKLGLSDDAAWGAAFAIARSIARKGTKANPFMRRAQENADPELKKLWGETLNIITRRLG